MNKNVIIVVEGKTDIEKVKSCFPNSNINILATNGLGISEFFLSNLKKLSQENEIIVMTDPDGPGMKIREKINEYLNNNCSNVFIDKKLIKNKNKIGIAEAEKEDIIFALKKSLKNYNRDNVSITWKEYVENNFYIKSNRIKIARSYSWNENINSKSLFRWINYINLTVEDIKKILRN